MADRLRVSQGLRHRLDADSVRSCRGRRLRQFAPAWIGDAEYVNAVRCGGGRCVLCQRYVADPGNGSARAPCQFAAFQAIDPKILVPDPPPVLLEITAEGKRFTRPGEGNAPTLAQLKAQTYDIRQGITQWQSTLDDKSLDTLLLKPTINAGFNAARRTSDDPGTRTPAGQLGLSALANGGAGVVQKAMLETGKAMARTGQVSVPDLLGGQQRLNLFSLAVPDKTRRPAQWSDAVYFPPNYLLETGKEGLALARQALSTTNAITTALRDVLGRHMLSNVLANFASLGAGRLIAAPLRGGNENGSVAGEAANSTATVVQQAVQTLFNDTVWNALKAKNGANTTQATRLDQERAVTAPIINAPSNARFRRWPSPSTRRSRCFRRRRRRRLHTPWKRGTACACTGAAGEDVA